MVILLQGQACSLLAVQHCLECASTRRCRFQSRTFERFPTSPRPCASPVAPLSRSLAQKPTLDEAFGINPLTTARTVRPAHRPAGSTMADKVVYSLRTNVERLGARLGENLAGQLRHLQG